MNAKGRYRPVNQRNRSASLHSFDCFWQIDVNHQRQVFINGQNKKPQIFSVVLMGLFETCPDTLSPNRVSSFRCHSELCLPPQGEGLEAKVQGQLAEWPQKPRLPLSTSDPVFHTSMRQQWADQFAAFIHIFCLGIGIISRVDDALVFQ